MVGKVLITGRNKIMVNDVYERMPVDFEAKKCGATNHEIKKVLTIFSPDIVLICLEREENGELMLYDLFFKQDARRSEVPLVVAGSHRDCERFSSYVESSATTYIYRPLSLDQVLHEISDKLYRMKILEEKRQAEAAAKAEQKRKKIILLVDDDIRLLKSLQAQLSEEYQVAAAISGQVALSFLEHHKCDLILLDYLMPEEDGPAVLEKIRKMPGGDQIPVIFLTSVKQADLVKQCLALRPQGYVLKPVQVDRLIKRMEEVLGVQEDSV